jgi:hypothetical protein
MAVMSLNRSNANFMANNTSDLDYAQLVAEFLTIIEDERNCSASLADPDPITGDSGTNAIRFMASSLGTLLTGTTNPIPIEIFSADMSTTTNSRARERISINPPYNKYGNITITEVLLHLPDYSGPDLNDPKQLQAEIMINGEKKISTDQSRMMRPIFKTIIINVYPTATPGESEIRGCGEIGRP